MDSEVTKNDIKKSFNATPEALFKIKHPVQRQVEKEEEDKYVKEKQIAKDKQTRFLRFGFAFLFGGVALFTLIKYGWQDRKSVV